MAKLLVTDFDGTITDNDFYELALAYTDRENMPDYWSDYARGRITHFEAMRGIFGHIRCTQAQMEALVSLLRPDPQLQNSVAALRRAGWDVMVVSAGSSWYIDLVLEGIDVAVHANPGHFHPAHGLHIELPVSSRFYSASHGIDKSAVVKDGLARYEAVAFAGNGPPDLEPSLLVKPELRFARSWLAEELRKKHIPFREFTRWSQIAHSLLAL